MLAVIVQEDRTNCGARAGRPHASIYRTDEEGKLRGVEHLLVAFAVQVTKMTSVQAVTVQNMSFKAGQTLTVTGVVNPNATSFAINVGHEKDIALHVNPRFDAHGDQRTIVCNSYQGGKWCEEVRDTNFPFQLGKEFKITVTFNAQEFQVTLANGTVIRFPNRPGQTKYRVLKFEGDARIRGMEIK
ncbi:hypothetical protein GJAV_G00222520 [Gymnothorax javanicus]|nr:hypothetical protein GJAV_G00222520 [Gymnothorax javanicus]